MIENHMVIGDDEPTIVNPEPFHMARDRWLDRCAEDDAMHQKRMQAELDKAALRRRLSAAIRRIAKTGAFDQQDHVQLLKDARDAII